MLFHSIPLLALPRARLATVIIVVGVFTPALSALGDDGTTTSAATYTQSGAIAYRDQNYATARRFWLQGATAGDAEAQYSLGLLYDLGRGGEQNMIEAMRWYRAAAENGHGVAALNVAVLYDSGRGVPRDAAAAALWYEKAAQLGQARAMYNLGQLYENGDGVRRDERVALNWYDRAAKNGIDAGVQRATALRRRLPASGGKPEMTQVALTMPRETSPDSGDQRNAEISAPIDLHQAEQLFALGNRYANGKGMARDDAKAVSLYKAAAAAGLAAAQNNLGFMYAEGRGVKRDDTEAAEWYRRAADQDYPPAITGLGMLYQEGRGVAQNYARALGLYAKASNLGYAQATANLGAMYGKGQGVALDRATAAFFMSMAKAQPRQGSGIYVDSGS